MGEYFWNLAGRFIDFQCDFYDCIVGVGHTDYLEAFVATTLLSFFALSASMLFASWLHRWWTVKSHREDIAVTVLLVIAVPMTVVFAAVVVVENKRPLIKGTRECLKRFLKKGILFIRAHI